MLSLVQSWFSPGANPVGIDFGADYLRLAQVERLSNTDYKLIAAASAEVPFLIRKDPQARLSFFAHALKELWGKGNFRGRRAVLGLPSSEMHIHHLRMPRMDDEALRKAIPWELASKLPFDANTAVLRHVIAGDVYAGSDQKLEVVAIAAKRESVEELLATAGKARIDVVGMNVDPKAIMDCFLHIYRRKSDADINNCFVDIGYSGTRVVVARGGQIMFARNIPIGGDAFDRAVAVKHEITLEEARQLRTKLANGEPDSHGPAASAPDPTGHVQHFHPEIDSALRPVVEKLVEELSLCRRYHESTFPQRPIQRLIFVGGEARQRGLCQGIARKLNVAAQVGDPLVRMGRTTDVGVESGIDRRVPQPAWACAIGLSMGSSNVAETTSAPTTAAPAHAAASV